MHCNKKRLFDCMALQILHNLLADLLSFQNGVYMSKGVAGERLLSAATLRVRWPGSLSEVRGHRPPVGIGIGLEPWRRLLENKLTCWDWPRDIHFCQSHCRRDHYVVHISVA